MHLIMSRQLSKNRSDLKKVEGQTKEQRRNITSRVWRCALSSLMLAKNELNCSQDNLLLACLKNSLPSSRVEPRAATQHRNKSNQVHRTPQGRIQVHNMVGKGMGKLYIVQSLDLAENLTGCLAESETAQSQTNAVRSEVSFSQAEVWVTRLGLTVASQTLFLVRNLFEESALVMKCVYFLHSP